MKTLFLMNIQAHYNVARSQFVIKNYYRKLNAIVLRCHIPHYKKVSLLYHQLAVCIKYQDHIAHIRYSSFTSSTRMCHIGPLHLVSCPSQGYPTPYLCHPIRVTDNFILIGSSVLMITLKKCVVKENVWNYLVVFL